MNAADPSAAGPAEPRPPIHPNVPIGAVTRELGHYGITNTLVGKGQFAKVYVAYDLRNGDKVAARISSVDKEDIDAEHKLLRKINNSFSKPYVIKAFDKFTSPKYFVMIMEFCEGGDLDALIKQQGALPFASCRRFFAQITTALKCMRSINAVHRDLKPANVMLTVKDLQAAEVRLIDFGFAKRANLMLSVKGTPAYMAPERLMKETYGFDAEVYGAGVILFEMVFGFQPFASASSVTALYAEQSALKIPNVRQCQMNAAPEEQMIPESLRDLLSRCLAVDAPDRPSVDDILSHEWLQEEPQRQVSPQEQQQTASPAPQVHVDPTASPAPEAVTPVAGGLPRPGPFKKLPPGAAAPLHGGPGTPMVKRASAPLTVPPPTPPLNLSMAIESRPSQATLHLSADGASPDERLILTWLSGATAIADVIQDAAAVPPAERIVIASYGVDLINNVQAKIVAQQAAGAVENQPGASVNSFCASIANGSMVNASFSRASQPTAMYHHSALMKGLKDRCKAAVRDALTDLKDPNATTPPPVLLLLAYIRRALLTAARQELLRNAHCVFGHVLEVYDRCDAMLRALETDPSVADSAAARTVARLRERLRDRIVGASSLGGTQV